MTTDLTAQPEDADRDGEGGLPPRPWERQPDESPAAWAAFQKYRDMGLRRTLDAVSREVSSAAAPDTRPSSASRRRRNGTVSGWSVRHDWVARAAAWDAETDRLARLAQIEAVQEMSARHVQVARALQERAVQALQALSPADMAATDILRYLIEATRLERLALGEPTDRSEQKVHGGTSLVVEVVERIVPVRGDDRPVPSPTVRRIEGVAPGTAHEDGAGDDLAAFALPDEPPPFLRRT